MTLINSIYETHFNGGRPFKVEIKDNNVNITNQEDTSKVYTYNNVNKIWIGESPKTSVTEFGGGYGENFLGNSILLEIDDECVFIGHTIFKFKPLSKINFYLSEVGNNDVPYPYAIDYEGNYYLMLDNIIILEPGKLEDPYNYYYKNNTENSKILDIEYIIGDDNEPIRFDFQTNPEEYYDGINNLYVKKNNINELIKLSKEEYINMMNILVDKFKYKNMDIVNIG